MTSLKRLLTYDDPVIKGFTSISKKGRKGKDLDLESPLILFVLVLCIMNKGQNGVSKVKGSRQQRQVSHNQTNLKFVGIF